MGLRRHAARLRHHVRRVFVRTPYLWDAAMWVRADKRSTLARRDSALVIEGFPRSGNTFSVAAFVVANGADLHLGRHLHGAPHLIRAVRLGVPAVVLVRAPGDAVASFLVRWPELTVEEALVEYLDFYRTAWRVRDQLVVGMFDTVVSDFGSVVEMVNRRYGTSFRRFEHTTDNQAAAFALVEEMNRLECRGEVVETHVGRPSESREEAKEAIRAGMASPGAARLLAEARDLHDRFVALAGTQAAATD